MKILFVSHSGRISGGANRSLISLMCGLREKYGITPCLLTPEKNSELEKACRDIGIEVYTAKYHSCCTVFRSEPKDVLKLAKILVMPLIDRLFARKAASSLPKDIDLVYTNDRMITVGAYIAKLRGIPHIWHVRSYSRENKTSYAPYYYKLIDRYSQRVILISDALRKVFAQHITPSKLCLVYNGVRIDDYASEKQQHDGFNLLLAGRIVPPKGQIDAIMAMEKVASVQDCMDVELFLAGEMPEYEEREYFEKLKARISAAGLEKRIHFLGEVKDMLKLRGTIDAELVCSWNEAFGRVSIEAMCAAIPVIGTDCGGTAEIVVDGETGYLYPSGDSDKLAEIITRCRKNPQKAEELGKNGFERVKQKFSIDITCESVYGIIKELLLEELR